MAHPAVRPRRLRTTPAIRRLVAETRLDPAQLVLPSGVAASAVPGSSSRLRLKDGTMTTAFVEYQLNRRWNLKLNVNNLLDETFIVGAQHAAAIDPSQPRTFSLM